MERLPRVPGLNEGWTTFLTTLGYFALAAPLFWVAGLGGRLSLYAIMILIAVSGGLFQASEVRTATRLGWEHASPRRSLKLLRRWDVVVLVAAVLIAPGITTRIPNDFVGAAVLLFTVTCVYVVVQRRAVRRLELPAATEFPATPSTSLGETEP
jgi:hypothetical protein